MEQNLSIFCEKFLTFSTQRIPFVVITMVATRGSAPQNVGARMIVSQDEILFGTVGGGKVENRCLEVARVLLNEKAVRPVHHTWNLQRDIGMTCGGEASFLFEPNRPEGKWNICIFGAGHVAQELVRTLLRLDCLLTVVDNRKEWLERLPQHPQLTCVHSDDMAKELDRFPDECFVLCMTMGHATDTPILYRALKERNFPYLGVIGSAGKRRRIEAELQGLGLEAERISRFICPIGKKIGSNSPNEIAISTAAELMEVRDSYRAKHQK